MVPNTLPNIGSNIMVSVYGDQVINICSVLIFIGPAYITYLVHKKKYTVRIVLINMTYIWMPMLSIVFSLLANTYMFIASAGLIYILWIRALSKSSKRMEDEESRGITAYLIKDKKIQEHAYMQMTDEEKVAFQVALKKPDVNKWAFTMVYWGVPVAVMILFQFLTGIKMF